MIRTRFAPSPTGYLHIGGVRTALFCWLFARHHGDAGRFILRIDDTDRQRNIEEALAPILDGLRWLGIDWDEGPGIEGPFGPYRQSERVDQHRLAAEELLDRGLAYHDYATIDEVQQERKAARADGRPFVYSRRWMAESSGERARFEAEGRQAVIRLKMPREGSLTIDDLVRGPVEFQWAQEQDHVIQRADGSCLYHLASAIDDHQMEISHVIRAEEHLSNTPRQVFILQSLGYELPRFAHLPFVAEPGTKTKLSKRKLKKYLKNRDFAAMVEHGRRIAETIGLESDLDTFNPVIVDFYRQVGYLPEALLNYLALLGWSLDDKTEHFSRDALIEHFSLDRVNKAPASFDPQKLIAFQVRHIMELPVEKRLNMVLPYLEQAKLIPSIEEADTEMQSAVKSKVTAILEAANDRVKVAGDILDYADFFLPDDQLVYNEKVFEKRLRKPPEAVGLLSRFKDELAQAESFDTESLDALMHRFIEREEIKIGQIIHAARVAVTGKSVGFGLFDTLTILGKEQCLARLDRALGRV